MAKNEDMQKALLKLFDGIEQLAENHSEVYDTDVRESIHLALNHHFVWGVDMGKSIVSFGMFSRDGDERLAGLVDGFIRSVEVRQAIASVSSVESRLAMLQDGGIKTSNGRKYDEFFGHVDTALSLEPLPKHMYQSGDYS